jgi:hypothetical protein
VRNAAAQAANSAQQAASLVTDGSADDLASQAQAAADEVAGYVSDGQSLYDSVQSAGSAARAACSGTGDTACPTQDALATLASYGDTLSDAAGRLIALTGKAKAAAGQIGSVTARINAQRNAFLKAAQSSQQAVLLSQQQAQAAADLQAKRDAAQAALDQAKIDAQTRKEQQDQAYQQSLQDAQQRRADQQAAQDQARQDAALQQQQWLQQTAEAKAQAQAEAEQRKEEREAQLQMFLLQATMPQAFAQQGQQPQAFAPYGQQPQQQIDMTYGAGASQSPAFDPGTQLFGMGALTMARNPNVPASAMIEQGYRINGPMQYGWKLTRPDGTSFAVPQHSVLGTVMDPLTGVLVYSAAGHGGVNGLGASKVPDAPGTSPMKGSWVASTGSAASPTTSSAADAITAVTPLAQSIADSVVRMQEARYGRGPAQEAPSAGMPGWAMALGALGVGAAIAFAVSKKK